MSIAQVLRDFAASGSGGAIVLQGRWGVGKTYFWRHRIVAELLRSQPGTRYSYVSLFGINSLAELKTALAMATAEFDEGSTAEDLPAATERAKWLFRRNVDKAPDALSLIPTFGSQLARIAEKVGFFLVKQRLICIDDLERRGKDLDLRDVLGLVSFLAEERQCRVVVILNAGHLDDSDARVWEAYREKVFRGELTYSPSLQQSIELGLSPYLAQPWSGDLRVNLELLGIGNIRLIRRTAEFMHLAMRTLPPPVPEPMRRHMADMLAILVFSVHGRGDGGPPIKRVLREFSAAERLSQGKDDARSDQEKAWDDQIHHYGAHPHRPLDLALLRMVQEGYPDVEALRLAAEDFELNERLYAQKDAWHRAWRAFQDTFQDNGEEIVEAFERTWPPVARVERAHNLQSMAELLRAIGRADLATRFVREWVDYRRSECPEQLDSRQIQMFATVRDPELLAACQQAADATQKPLSLDDAWSRLAGDRYDEPAVLAIGQSSAEALVDLLERQRSEDLVKQVRHVLQLRGNGRETWDAASQALEQACATIAARSPLSAYRMKNWFGIEPRRS